MKTAHATIVGPYVSQGEDFASLKVIRDRVLGALAHHGMKAADPSPVAEVELGPIKGGQRTWEVQLGSYRAAGSYNLTTGHVDEKSWKFAPK
jgi:hypothetical protein